MNNCIKSIVGVIEKKQNLIKSISNDEGMIDCEKYIVSNEMRKSVYFATCITFNNRSF